MAIILTQEEFDLLDNPLRNIDSTIEQFAKDYNLIKKSDLWVSRLFEIPKKGNVFREIGIRLEYDEPESENLKKHGTYEIFGRAYYCYNSGRPAHRSTETIERGMKAPLDPKLVYQSLEKAYKSAKSITEEDLRESSECLKRIIEHIENSSRKIKIQ